MVKEKLEYQKYRNLRDIHQKKVSSIASYRMITFLIMIFSFILKYYYYPHTFGFICIISFFTFIFLVIIHNHYFKQYEYYEKYVEIIEQYLKREDGTWKKFEDTGSDFCNDKNLYLQDLDVLGPNSLFQYLSICRTLGGRKKLFQRLSNPEMKAIKLKEEQDAIAELNQQLSFCIDFQTLIDSYHNKKINLSGEFSLFKEKKENKKRDLYISLIASSLCIFFLILSIFHIITIQYFYGMFLFNYMISILYSYIYKEEFSSITKLLFNYGKLYPVTTLISNQNFTSKKLKKMKENTQSSKDSYIELKKIDTLNSLKDNFLSSFLLNGIFCLNLILMYSFNQFLNKSFRNLWNSILDIEELETMLSLAGIGILRQDICMPKLEEQIQLSFLEIKHPLLDEKKCIPNDFNTKNGVQIITGSNMGGKTSFLRTIGVNLILMNAGTYVCAKSFKASYFKIFTSMRIADNIEKGISTFYGELLRIQEVISYLGKGNMIVFIDEIFKGTNYQDRIYGAKQVIQKLNRKDTLVFLTTHDFELCEEKNITNYHVQEEYENGKILFDYKIRKGKCSSTNAKYLMKQLGIIDK